MTTAWKSLAKALARWVMITWVHIHDRDDGGGDDDDSNGEDCED